LVIAYTNWYGNLQRSKKKIMAVKQTSTEKKSKVKVSRPGVHAKSKSSKLKTSKNYKKPYAGGGR